MLGNILLQTYNSQVNQDVIVPDPIFKCRRTCVAGQADTVSSMSASELDMANLRYDTVEEYDF